MGQVSGSLVESICRQRSCGIDVEAAHFRVDPAAQHAFSCERFGSVQSPVSDLVLQFHKPELENVGADKAFERFTGGGRFRISCDNLLDLLSGGLPNGAVVRVSIVADHERHQPADPSARAESVEFGE
ncbi:hypothetical protein [Microbacterium sp.]|uniref:hypothetical protein n=1 Tax=Microbacterium sp. TaxID=51671 RepID=UPI003562036A